MFKILNRESKTIIGAATIVGVLSFVSRIVGLIRDRILAGQFGAGDTLDIYYAAFKIPDLLFTLIVVGALSASFIPLFLSHYSRASRRKKAWDFTNNTLHLVAGTMVLLSICLILFADPLAQIVAPGFAQYKQVKVAQLMRIMFSAQVLLSISMIYGSVLQSLKRFLLYALAPIFYNFGIIIGALYFVEPFGTTGLAWGVVLGASLHLLTQVMGVRQTDYRFQFRPRPFDKDALTMLKLMGPRTLGLAVNQVLFVILTIIASTLAIGSVTIFQFAYNIQFFAVGIIGVSFAIAVFPSLSEAIESGEKEKFVELFISTTRQVLYLMIPMMLLFLILRAQIVRVVVGAGAFDWAATISTADTLAFFALTFIPQALIFLLARAFYALHDTVTPLMTGAVSALVGLLAAFALRDSFGVTALAMAYSLAALINVTLMWVILRQRMGSLAESQLLVTIYKLSAAGLVATVVMQILKPVAISIISLDTFIGVLTQGLFAGGLGLLAYVGVCSLLKVKDQKLMTDTLKRKVLRRIRPEEALDSLDSI
jgi:putative peptidoglycan lipid II flippase